MKPKDVEALRVLRFEAGKAMKAADDFEASSSVAPEGSEELTYQDRFENAWIYLKTYAEPLVPDYPVSHTPIRLVQIGTPENYADWGLRFELDEQIDGERTIRAAWTYWGTVKDGVSTDGQYTYNETYRESYIEREWYPERLANVETSMASYDAAIELDLSQSTIS